MSCPWVMIQCVWPKYTDALIIPLSTCCTACLVPKMGEGSGEGQYLL